METSSILTILLTIIAVAGAGIYGSDHIFESQSLSEEDINETISEDQETNEETIGEGREIQGRDGADETSSEDEGRNTLDISIVSPSENAKFEVVEDEEKEIEFQYDIISSSEGKATLTIGEKEIEENIEEGNQRITSNIELQPGEYEWNINADNDILTEVSSSQNIEIMETGIEEGVLELSDNPAIEQYNTITLYQKDETVQGEEILINGEPYGETDEFGELTVQIPNTEEITITTQNQIDEKTREVAGYEYVPAEINFLRPETSGTIENYRVNFAFGIEAKEEVEYELKLDGRRKASGHLSQDEQLGYNEDHIITDSGSHEAVINVIQDAEIINQKTRDFETTQDRPISELNLNTPEDGYQLTDYEGSTTLGYDIVSYESGELRLMMNETILKESQVDANDETQYFDYELSYSDFESGEYMWHAEFQFEDEVMKSSERVIEFE